MKTLRRVSLGLAVLAAVVLATPNLGSAYSYNAWVGMTGAKTLVLNPLYYINTSTFAGSFIPKLDFGFTDKFDVFVDFTGWVMPRYDISGNNLAIVGVKFGAGPGIEVHGIWDELDIFAIEYNVAYFASAWDFSGSDINIIVAPTLKLGNFGVWVEADYWNAITGGTFDLNAGIYINAGDNQISVGLTEIITGGYGIGAWLWAPFGLN